MGIFNEHSLLLEKQLGFSQLWEHLVAYGWPNTFLFLYMIDAT